MLSKKTLGSSGSKQITPIRLALTVAASLVGILALSSLGQEWVSMVPSFEAASVSRKFTNVNRQWKSKSASASAASADAIDLVSLTIGSDFHVLFNNSAITSWIRHIRNVRSVTFIGPSNAEAPFRRNMKIHYPSLQMIDDDDEGVAVLPIPIRWVNETHWIEKYMQPYSDKKVMPCPYWKVCQQLIKLHVFDLRTEPDLELKLELEDDPNNHNHHYVIGDNILIVDSDTVWGRDVTFVNGTDGKATYFEVEGEGKGCTNDPTLFTEAITMGPPPPPLPISKNDTNSTDEAAVAVKMKQTLTPFRTCVHPGNADDATGLRHIAHHMLFQYDVMSDLHAIINKAWNTTSVWDAVQKCYAFDDYCGGRVAEYELYYAFVSENYPQRMKKETLTNGVNIMMGSAICDEQEMECCREKSVVLKGCHDHRIKSWKDNPKAVGDMCC